jgi:hypothetical protein
VVIAEGGDFEHSPTLLRPTTPHIIDDEASHHSSGVGHEACVIDENRFFLAGDRNVGFVQESGDPEAVDASSPGELPPGEAAEVPVQRSEERISDNRVIANGL